MDWVNPRMRRRGPAWKQGWTDNTLASISLPSFHLVVIFSIVTFLLWLSQFTTSYRPNSIRYPSAVISFQLFFVLLPFIGVLCLVGYAGVTRFNYVMRAVPLLHHEVDEPLANRFQRS
ncbi:hypothetical protein MLD38_026795 [Melastoma candidum]|uniref:Uncharacterized protein n=1 Tax=Melastoma candidum TaxID=119954 RepID=A0ACB9P121_9MYRT|nr:hypothetical protein MLD38_026795 [Melastoma candidum]